MSKDTPSVHDDALAAAGREMLSPADIHGADPSTLVEDATAPAAAPRRPLASVPDDDLLRRLAEILGRSRHVETEIVAHIAEVDDRRLYAREAFPSMFAYCTDALHLSEAEAYLRIAAARASREHPVILDMLGDGRLHLSGIALLAPHLTAENRDTVLRRATHRSKRQIEELVAELAPRPDVPASMRKLPQRSLSTPSGMGNSVTRGPVALAAGSPLPLAADTVPLDAAASSRSAGTDPAAGPRAAVPERAGESAVGAPATARDFAVPDARSTIEPLAPGRHKVQFTASAELHEKLERLAALMGSPVPGDLAVVIEAAVTEKLERLEARRFGATSRPRKTVSTSDTSPGSRHVPAAVRREVRERDGDRCAFVDSFGRRCSERHRLEYHHRHPFGMGGDHRPESVSLVCKAHNEVLAERDYGRKAMARFRRSGRG